MSPAYEDLTPREWARTHRESLREQVAELRRKRDELRDQVGEAREWAEAAPDETLLAAISDLIEYRDDHEAAFHELARWRPCETDLQGEIRALINERDALAAKCEETERALAAHCADVMAAGKAAAAHPPVIPVMLLATLRAVIKDEVETLQMRGLWREPAGEARDA